jgi:hypothetical protein
VCQRAAVDLVADRSFRARPQGGGSADWPLRLSAAGILVSLCAVGAQTVAHLVNAFALNGRYPGLDAATEGNAFAWSASVATLAAGAAALTVVLAVPTLRFRGACLVVLVTFLAVDDMVDLHDSLASAAAPDLPGRLSDLGAWTMPVVYLPVLVTGFLLIARAAWDAPAPAARPLWLGLALLTAAMAIRVGAGIVKLEGEVVPGGFRAVGVAVGQGAELGGWILVAAGLGGWGDSAGRGGGRTAHTATRHHPPPTPFTPPPAARKAGQALSLSAGARPVIPRKGQADDPSWSQGPPACRVPDADRGQPTRPPEINVPRCTSPTGRPDRRCGWRRCRFQSRRSRFR